MSHRFEPISTFSAPLLLCENLHLWSRTFLLEVQQPLWHICLIAQFRKSWRTSLQCWRHLSMPSFYLSPLNLKFKLSLRNWQSYRFFSYPSSCILLFCLVPLLSYCVCSPGSYAASVLKSPDLCLFPISPCQALDPHRLLSTEHHLQNQTITHPNWPAPPPQIIKNKPNDLCVLIREWHPPWSCWIQTPEWYSPPPLIQSVCKNYMVSISYNSEMISPSPPFFPHQLI